MEQPFKQMCIVLRIVSILSPTNNFAIQQENVWLHTWVCVLWCYVFTLTEKKILRRYPNYCLTVIVYFVCVCVCLFVLESLSPAASESMRLCIRSPHSWCMLATNIWILVPRVPLLIRGWWGVEGSGGDSSPVSMNLPVSQSTVLQLARALCPHMFNIAAYQQLGFRW